MHLRYPKLQCPNMPDSNLFGMALTVDKKALNWHDKHNTEYVFVEAYLQKQQLWTSKFAGVSLLGRKHNTALMMETRNALLVELVKVNDKCFCSNRLQNRIKSF